MRKSSNSRQGLEVPVKSIGPAELELAISSLMEKLSHLRAETRSLIQMLRTDDAEASVQNANEAEIMMKHALRLLGEAMSRLRG